MKPQEIQGLFRFNYERSSEEICSKMTKKVIELKAKVEERRKRIAGIRSEYKISDAMIIDLLSKARRAMQQNNMMVVNYSTTAVDQDENGMEREVVVGAGVINGLLTESDFIEAEEAAIDKLTLISRNLRDLTEHEGGRSYTTGHRLSEAELRYLGF